MRLGMQRLNPLPPELYAALGEDAADNVYWAPSGNVTATFSSLNRSAGCQNLVEHSVLQKGRSINNKVLSAHKVSAKEVAGELVAGKFDKGGSVTVILDILVNDQVDGQVRGGLLVRKLPPGAGVDFTGACHASKRPFSLPFILGGAAGKPAHCCVCGHMFAAHLLSAGPHTRLPQFGYEVGRDLGESISHSLARARALSLSLARSLAPSLSLALAPPSNTQTLSLSLSLSVPHSLSLFLSLSLSRALSLSLARSLALALALARLPRIIIQLARMLVVIYRAFF
jgi:hypothetical protein